MAESAAADAALTEDEAREPMAFIARQLANQARGEPIDRDKLKEACTLVAAAELVRAGMSMDAVERQFRDRDHSFRIAWEPCDDGEPGLVVEVRWLDEEDGGDG